MKKYKLPLFKIRPHAISKIMSEPKTKADKEAGLLSQTTKTYVDMWIKEQLYKRRKTINTSPLQKGLMKEDESIELIAKHFKYDNIVKNEKVYENDYMIGTPDVIMEDRVIDVKNSFDFSTFPLHDTKIESSTYKLQLQGYMKLLNLDKAELIYTLMDSPDEVIEREFRFSKLPEEEFEAFRKNMIYEDISIETDAELRVKKFELERDDLTIEKVEEKVDKIRKYITELGYEIE